MSLFVNSSFVRASPRSITNPVSRRTSLSLVDGTFNTCSRSVQFLYSAPQKHAPCKAVPFASLSINKPRLTVGHSSRGHRMRSVSMFSACSGLDSNALYTSAPGCTRLIVPPSSTETTMSSEGTSVLVLNASHSTQEVVPCVPSPAEATTTNILPIAPGTLMTSNLTTSSFPMIHTLSSPSPTSFSPLRQKQPLIEPCLSSSSSESAMASSSSQWPTARARRSPPPYNAPSMHLVSSASKHTLDVRLPPEIQPEMVTISAKKGDRLNVVADAWHMEQDCHYEWQISFAPRDIDMSSIHAKFDPDGRLTIDIQRLHP